MKYRDVLRFSLRGIRTSPLRSALSALSVAVGTGALLIIASLGLFGRTQIENGLARIGVSGLAVSTDEGGAGTPLSAALAERMAQAVPGIKAASPVRAVGGTVRAGHRTSGVVLLGADENLGEVMQVELLAGALPSQAQVESRAAVAVVGDDLAERLYGRVNITGREIRISRNGREQIFTVCGVMRAQTGALGGALSAIAPELVYVPYGLLAESGERADQVFVSCAADADPDAVGRSISRYLETRGQVTGTVYVRSISGAVETVQHLASLGTLLFFAVGGIALLVSLLGVFSSMLSAAHERTNEIGILLALGARKRDIRRIFLSEAVLLWSRRSCARVERAAARRCASAAGMAADSRAPAHRSTLRRYRRTAPCGTRRLDGPHRSNEKITRTKQKRGRLPYGFLPLILSFQTDIHFFAVKNRRGKRKMISPLLCTG